MHTRHVPRLLVSIFLMKLLRPAHARCLQVLGWSLEQSRFFYLRIRPANYFNTKKNLIKIQRILTRVSKT